MGARRTRRLRNAGSGPGRAPAIGRWATLRLEPVALMVRKISRQAKNKARLDGAPDRERPGLDLTAVPGPCWPPGREPWQVRRETLAGLLRGSKRAGINRGL